ncbi:type I restriction enzyme M protein [Methylobacter tundripaludum]|uniref:site-specific DNA-methyltransferase (adenine-specific) n=1 Tax=Methylobacter tundripaludum TaxID=173365 RepID=A0A2S6GSK3_9GAMM|nr:class I SAM-dependent DNA methyltransferase [Methylobacter tundripaludum]PPK68179.1 type I restriction enzyme M protein [Methylobacter tundripaludum]
MNKDQLKKLEADLWSAADKLRANSDLKASEYSTPVLGLIFLKFADNNYRRHEAEIIAEYQELKGSRREKPVSEIAIEKCGFYLHDHARYDYLLNLPEEKDIAKALKEAMKLIEEYKPELEGVLPKDEYAALTRTDKTLPQSLLRTFADIPADATGDLFGQIYEYFLSEFARSEGQKGGEFFTPRSVVRLMVEIIEPHGGKVFDPACGSGGMFVQSAQFIAEHRKELKGSESGVYVCGQEKTRDTVNLAKMNLAVNGLRGEIKQANTYYEDPYQSFGAFDYVLANPPFNVDDVSLSSVEKDSRFNTYGIPRNKSKVKKADEGKETVPNGNYLWINLFATSLKDQGRAALVMANSASDARHSEADIRKTLIEQNLIYAMLTLPSNMFYTVTLPATLWFFDKAKTDDKILFIDARNIYTQIDRAHREFSEEHIQNIAIISQLHKGRRDKFVQLIDRYFAAGMERLIENKTKVEPVSAQLLEVLDDVGGKQAVGELVQQWAGLAKLKTRYEKYLQQKLPVIPNACEESSAPYKISPVGRNDNSEIYVINKAQQQLREAFDPFFAALHEGLKRLDKTVRRHEKQQAEQAKAEGKRATTDRKTRVLKTALEELHKEVKNAEIFYQHIHRLQERFPKAEYEDVTGLCKLASPADVKEQEYSLNAGRYVGVVIEEDGKTEEEFVADLLAMNEELFSLNDAARELEKVISHNVAQIAGEG